ncbi:MAG: glutathione S-transferase [Sneathiella sp.]|nr:glutathione S-transferase [Sneathiella sp.]
MRARMAILLSGLTLELRDVLLKDKPVEMTSISPKATVPVLAFPNGHVLEESLDIMLWAVEQGGPDNSYPQSPEIRTEIMDLIEENDGSFKRALDRYKYHVRFPENTREEYRCQAEVFLSKLEGRLNSHTFLISDNPNLADIAIFPFIRQFANSDRQWFDQAPYPALQKWLNNWTASASYLHIMKKRPIWEAGLSGPFFPTLENTDVL